eukprot:CAMPEP_0194268366 /NCGR_PEP_ID=MMETSP0169-20130528/2715_1 /TAXON_ID=218684 /ORGANISM="Corethron pennatum, Strain L29A3" /LENGTH=116 /DNA_ID=CAMNT_0039009577 /DNA_START=58 /DNA_END=404 /DNA_ORIENTATION=+
MPPPSALGKRKSASEGDTTLLHEASSANFLKVDKNMLAYNKAVAKVCERIWDKEAEAEFEEIRNSSEALTTSLRKLRTAVSKEKQTTETKARDRTAAAQRAQKREAAHVRTIAELR